MMTKLGLGIGLMVGAALGSLVAQGLTAGVAGACECYPAGFVYQLVGVEGPEGAPDHSPYWPSKVHLDETGSNTLITSYLAEGHDEHESLDRVTGEAP